MNGITYLATKRLNIDLMLYVNPKGVLCIGVRLRPWQQQGKKPLMVLAQGLSLDDAIDKAARDYHLDRWQELDWRRRPWDSAIEQYEVAPGEDVLEFLNIPPNEADELLSGAESLVTPLMLPLTRKMGKTAT